MIKTLLAKILTLTLGVFVVSSLLSCTAHAVDSTSLGSWTTVANCPGINPIHTALLPSGKVLMVAGSGYNGNNFNLKINQAWVYNPATPGTCPREIPLPVGKDLFCAGMTHLPDGRILVFGGTGKYGVAGSQIGQSAYYHGIKQAYVFNEADNSFTPMKDMAVGRWYGTGVKNSNGDINVLGGLDENGAFTNVNERFNAATQTWSKLLTPPWAFPLYAGMVLLSNGTYAYSGTYFGTSNGRQPMTWNASTNAYKGIPGLGTAQCRDQANTLVMWPKAYVLPGGCKTGTTGTVYSFPINVASPVFKAEPYAMPGMHQCGQVLPDKSLFISGGTNHNVQATATMKAMRLGFGATKWQPLAAPKVARGYHSTCLTLKDGRVLTMGTDWNGGAVETRLEVYNPWYTQPGFTRPTMSLAGVAPKTACGVTPLKAGTKVNATYGYATPVSATLTPLPSNTHSSDPNQRVVPLSIVKTGTGTFSFTAPTASAITPKGIYMMSLLDWRGAPSVSQMITVGNAGCCC